MEEVKAEPDDSPVRGETVKAVIANVKRLIYDAELLLANGSPGSSLSLAILAFEEAGKGHAIELALDKPKTIHSKHEFRHRVAMNILIASFTQKYQMDLSAVAAKLTERHEKGKSKLKERQELPPMTNALRDELRNEIIPQLRTMTDEQIQGFGIESRWLEKIVFVVNKGGLEKLRQSGLYLDTNSDFSVLSSPISIEPIEAQRWIWAASRVLNLLEHGAFHQPYSPLSEVIAAAASGDTKAIEALEIAKSFVRSNRH